MSEKSITDKLVNEFSFKEYKEAVKDVLVDFVDYLTDEDIKSIYTNKNYQRYLFSTSLGLVRNLVVQKKIAEVKAQKKEELQGSAFNGLFLGSKDYRKKGQTPRNIRSARGLFYNLDDGHLMEIGHSMRRNHDPILIPATKYRVLYDKNVVTLKSGEMNTYYNLVEAGESEEVDIDTTVATLLEELAMKVTDRDQYDNVIVKGRIRDIKPLFIFKNGEVSDDSEPLIQKRYSGTAMKEGDLPTFSISIRPEDKDDDDFKVVTGYFRRQKHGMPLYYLGKDFAQVLQTAINQEGIDPFGFLTNIYRNRRVVLLGQLTRMQVDDEEGILNYADINAVGVVILPDDATTWADTYKEREQKKASNELKVKVVGLIEELDENTVYDTVEEVYKDISSELVGEDKEKILKIIEEYFEE